MSEAAPARVLVDSRGSPCPGPITDLSMVYRSAKVGDVIELWATDRGVKRDIHAWAAATGSRVLSIDDDDGKTVLVVEIRKRPGRHPDPIPGPCSGCGGSRRRRTRAAKSEAGGIAPDKPVRPHT